MERKWRQSIKTFDNIDNIFGDTNKKNVKNGKGLEVSSVVDDQGQGVINITVYKAEDISTVFSSSKNIFNIQFVFLSSYLIHGVETVSLISFAWRSTLFAWRYPIKLINYRCS